MINFQKCRNQHLKSYRPESDNLAKLLEMWGVSFDKFIRDLKNIKEDFQVLTLKFKKYKDGF